MKITAFTDGSANVKNMLGGFGSYIIFDDGKEKFLSGGVKNTKIGRMEIKAILETIKIVPKNIKVELLIYSDSQYCVFSFTKGWLQVWELENFFGRKNVDLWRSVLEELRVRPNLTFKIKHVKGHQDNLEDPICFGNNVADKLADYKRFKKYKKDLF